MCLYFRKDYFVFRICPYALHSNNCVALNTKRRQCLVRERIRFSLWEDTFSDAKLKENALCLPNKHQNTRALHEDISCNRIM